MANTSCSGSGTGSIAATEGSYSGKFHAAQVQEQPVPEGSASKVNPHFEFCYRVAERFGIPVVILTFVLWWARHDLIAPLMEAHFGFLDKISTAHEKHVEELQSIGDKLDTLIRISDDK